MIRISSLRRGAQLAAVLAVAVGLKAFYSTASVNQLRWVLAPTTWLVELLTGARFQFESFAGYLNREHTFVIAAACAGVNFLITCFLMLALGKLWRNRSRQTSWLSLTALAGIAYLTTVIANTVRIAVALQLRAAPQNFKWLSAEQLHRVEGVLIYFGFLLLLFTLVERIERPRRAQSINSRAASWIEQSGLAATGRHLRVWLFPLAIYYAMTLGIPIINGAHRSAEFWEHSRFVLLIPLVLVLPLAVASLLVGALLSLAQRQRSAARDRTADQHPRVPSVRPRRRLSHPAMLPEFPQPCIGQRTGVAGRDIRLDVKALAHSGNDRADVWIAENEAQC